MSGTITPGLRHEPTAPVDGRLIVPSVAAVFTGFREMPPASATAFMVGLVEWACIRRVGRKGRGDV